MRLSDYLRPELILSELAARGKREVLGELVEAIGAVDQSLDLTKARQVLLDRENLGTTGIGGGVAIPHGKIDGLCDIILVVGRSQGGVDFEALDGQPCHIFFMVLAPEQAAGMHLRILALISKLLKDEGFRRSVMAAAGHAELLKLLRNV